MNAALCVGINRLSGFSERLAGAVNDAAFFARALPKYGFDPVRLADKEATKKAVLDAAAAGLAGLAPGEWFVWTHAGHGTRVYDKALGRWKEVLITYDPAWVSDQEVAELLEHRPAGTFVCLIFDTCYSGGMLESGARGLLAQAKPHRFLDPVGFADRLGLPVPDRGDAPTPTTLADRAGRVPGVMFYAACAAGELSYEANPGGLWRGWFSYHLGREVAAGGNFASVFLGAKAAMALKQVEYPQTPVFKSGTKGMAGKRLFKEG